MISQCTRAACGGQILDSTCLLCSRSIIIQHPDLTPPGQANAIEMSLNRRGRPKGMVETVGVAELAWHKQPMNGINEDIYVPNQWDVTHYTEVWTDG